MTMLTEIVLGREYRPLPLCVIAHPWGNCNKSKIISCWNAYDL